MGIKFYLDKKNFTKDYQETAINIAAYWAVTYRKQTHNELLDFCESIFEKDVPEIIDTLKRMGETKFTISTPSGEFIKTLKLFDNFGAKMIGLTEVVEPINKQTIPAILMELK